MSTDTETAPAPAPLRRCFSGSGRYANRKWAPGGDATYLSRLRKAHLDETMLPDPWYIQEHGGVEAENVPEEGWPQLSAMDIARRLDQERGGGVESHWVHTLEQAQARAATKAAAKSQREATSAATRAEREAARAKAKNRPKKDTPVRRLGGERDGASATVLRAISPTQLLIRFEDGFEELVTDEDVERTDTVEDNDPVEEAQPEGEFQEQ